MAKPTTAQRKKSASQRRKILRVKGKLQTALAYLEVVLKDPFVRTQEEKSLLDILTQGHASLTAVDFDLWERLMVAPGELTV